MATADEILSMLEAANDMSYCSIDVETRRITIPPELVMVGVESDSGVESRWFRMPRMFGNVDLAEFTPRINYVNANGDGDVYIIEDMEDDGEYLTFSWTFYRKALAYKGQIQFVVCFYEPDPENPENIGREWNSTVGKFVVLRGLETTKQIESEYPDIIAYILENLGAASPEQIQAAVDQYLSENPVTPGATPEQAEQIEANRQAIEELKQSGSTGGGTGGAQINDSSTSASSTWSSKKISAEIENVELTPGPKGDKGDKGDTGATGPAGPSYTLPVATASILGGVRPAAKTDEMTKEIGVDADGKLWGSAGGSGASSDWELLGEVTSDGAGDASGIKVPVVVADYRALFIEAGPKAADVDLRVKLCPSNTAWWNGYGLIRDAMARTHKVQCFVMNFSGKLRAFVGAQDGWDTVTATQYQIPMYPAMSPREDITTDAGYQYIVVDTATSTGVVPEGLVLTVYGMK